jgi:hypothetical protein
MATLDAEGNEVVSGTYTVYTAASAQQELLGDGLDAEAAEAAEDANVTHPAYVNYVTAIENYELRSDTEPLAGRRARTVGDAIEDGNQYRAIVPTDPVSQPLGASTEVGGFQTKTSQDFDATEEPKSASKGRKTSDK